MTLEEAQELITSLNESVKKLEAKNAEIISEKQNEASKRAEAEKAKSEAEEKIAKEKGDFEKLLEIEKAKNTEIVEKLSGENTARFNQLQDQLLTSQVSNLSNKLGNDENDALLLKPHIKQRLKLEDENGELKLKVLDDNGNVTDKTIEDLENEFKEKPIFAKNVKGRSSSGGGAGGSGGSGGSVNANEYEKYYKHGTADYNFDKKMELKQSDPTAHEALLKKYPAQL